MIDWLSTFPPAYYWLIPVGFVVGVFGTLIGVGGGFVLVPLLLLLYPQESPEIITCISLAMVFFNALSGSLAYGRMKRIDYKSGLLLAAATVPGAIAGALVTNVMPRRLFDLVFGIVMMLICGFLLFRPRRKPDLPSRPIATGDTKRTLIEADGTAHAWTYNAKLGAAISLFVGFFSSVLGIGGGIIQVPVLAYTLNFPILIATATTQFILMIMSLAGVATHIVVGDFTSGWRRLTVLTIGVIIGAQLGAYLSKRVQGDWIIRGLAVALGLVGVRILFLGLS
ncbi:MAG: sulfite exporter TauE/SafE family protein [Dehalococcoidia bacterium]|nr:sulfite exporter TauE/SafE family protein [Dehalococcoidia bacterium]